MHPIAAIFLEFLQVKKCTNLYLRSFRQMAAAYPQVLIAQRTLFQVRTDIFRRPWLYGKAPFKLRVYF